MKRYTCTAKLWIWPGEKAAWHFITVPKKESQIIKSNVIVARGFGSVKVEVTIGTTTWRTSIFPDSKSGTYLLPIKAAVRCAELLEVGDTCRVTIAVL
jgi:hypothetical protein